MDLVRSLVSKKKRRWEEDGFNLDLTYITDQIIAMGFPSEGAEGLFRNPLSEVQRFLNQRHEGHYHVYNLCSERSYKAEKFGGNVSCFPFADHNAPPIQMIGEFCAHVHTWLTADVRNVVAVHCKAGKGRTGTMICCYLLFCGAMKTAADVLEFYGVRRTYNGHGVTIPSQRRYVSYYTTLIGPDWDPGREKIHYSLRRIDISAIPRSETGEELTTWQPLFAVTRKDKTLLYVASDDASDSLLPSFQCDGLLVQGDLKFELYNGKSTKRLCWFWINTAFMEPGYCKISLSKHELDGAIKDKDHKIFPADFSVVVHFDRVLGRSRNKSSRPPPLESSTLDQVNKALQQPVTTKLAQSMNGGRTPLLSSDIEKPRASSTSHSTVPVSRLKPNQMPSSQPISPAVASPSTSPPSNTNLLISIPSLKPSSPSPSIPLHPDALNAVSNTNCASCGLALPLDSEEVVNLWGKGFHWACCTCTLCGESIQERKSCTIHESSNGIRAVICGNCDTFWVRCAFCKTALTDGNFSQSIPTIGKLCMQCFRCNICHAPFTRIDDDDYDEDSDAFDVIQSRIICRAHSETSRKIYLNRNPNSATHTGRPKSQRVAGGQGSPFSVAFSLSDTGALDKKPSKEEQIPLRTLIATKDEKKHRSLRKMKGMAIEMPRCGYCHGLIDVNSQTMHIPELAKTFHENHFKCAKCTSLILRGEMYHIADEHILCNDCYTSTATCYKCLKPLLGSYKQVGPELYVHKQCFTCDKCSKEIQNSFCEFENKTLCLTCAKLQYDVVV